MEHKPQPYSPEVPFDCIMTKYNENLGLPMYSQYINPKEPVISIKL